MRHMHHASRSENGRPGLSYAELQKYRLRGMRTGNWRRLNFVERALYNCVLRLARSRQCIVNAKLVETVRELIQRLLSTARTQIVKVGLARASALREGLERCRLIQQTQWVNGWLKKPETVFYLGLMEWANG